jgi:DNA polymerase elongation subunit (family B)
MSYVDALFDRENDIIKVVERNDQGERVFKEHPVRYTFYYPDQKGKFTSIYGDPLTRVVCKNTKDFRKEVAINNSKELYESDINPIFAHLSENYLNQDGPKLNICFFDIEVDFDPERGYSTPEDAFMPITAITVYLKWMSKLITLALPPKGMKMEDAVKLVADIPDTHLFDNEADMLETFLDLIQDADIISGWNSEGYDVPYTVNRVTRVLSKEDTRRFCLWNQFPKRREYEKYGKKAVTYDFHGRVHLDSLELYRKYTYEERHTYRLDAIGEMEIGKK